MVGDANCTDWLKEKMSDGEIHLCEMVREEARQRGYPKTELKVARKSLGVKTFHQFNEDGATPNWFWYLE